MFLQYETENYYLQMRKNTFKPPILYKWCAIINIGILTVLVFLTIRMYNLSLSDLESSLSLITIFLGVGSVVLKILNPQKKLSMQAFSLTWF